MAKALSWFVVGEQFRVAQAALAHIAAKYYWRLIIDNGMRISLRSGLVTSNTAIQLTEDTCFFTNNNSNKQKNI